MATLPNYVFVLEAVVDAIRELGGKMEDLGEKIDRLSDEVDRLRHKIY